jgi:hypothetical protein
VNIQVGGLQRGLKVVLDGRVFQANTGRLDELKAMLKPGGKGIVCLSMMLEDRRREVEIAMPGRFDISPAQKGAISTVPGVLEVVDRCAPRRAFLATRRTYAASVPRSRSRAGCSRDTPTASARCILTTGLVVFKEATVGDSSTRLRPPSLAR